MARGRGNHVANLLYGNRPRSHRLNKLAALETTRHLPWPGLRRLDAKDCLELLGAEPRPDELSFASGLHPQRTLWRGLPYRDHRGVRLPCITIAGGNDGWRGQLNFVAGIAVLGDDDKVKGNPEVFYTGDDLSLAVDAASALINPLEPEDEPDLDRAIEISWQIGERLGQAAPLTYADLKGAGLLEPQPTNWADVLESQ